MENQHRKIKGYRELSAEEIALMNEIKTKGAELLQLQRRAIEGVQKQFDNGTDAERERIALAEPWGWAAIGKTDIQTGIMALVRAIAQPEGV